MTACGSTVRQPHVRELKLPGVCDRSAATSNSGTGAGNVVDGWRARGAEAELARFLDGVDARSPAAHCSVGVAIVKVRGRELVRKIHVNLLEQPSKHAPDAHITNLAARYYGNGRVECVRHPQVGASKVVATVWGLLLEGRSTRSPYPRRVQEGERHSFRHTRRIKTNVDAARTHRAASTVMTFAEKNDAPMPSSIVMEDTAPKVKLSQLCAFRSVGSALGEGSRQYSSSPTTT